MRLRAAALLVGGALLLAACGSAQGAGTLVPTTSGSASVDPAVTASAPADLVAKADLAPCPASDPSVAPVADGLPDLTLPCLGEGPAVRLAGLRGTPYVVNLWASWCKPCRAELPLFAALDTATDEVALLGIDVQDDPASALSLLTEAGVHYPSVRDTGAATRPSLRWSGLPMTLFVAADGVVQHVERAPITSQEQLDGLVKTYLGVTA
ncbi:MAG: TlpA disulfide reductase family protein [Candidatus Nanopelagicales bacterium]